jgi:hypothetical protein
MRPAGGCAAVCRDIGFVNVDVLREVTPFRRILLLSSVAVESSLTLAHFYQIILRRISQESNSLSHRHENHKLAPFWGLLYGAFNFSVCMMKGRANDE